MKNTLNSFLEGLGLMPNRNRKPTPIMDALIANETNPDMKKILEEMEPVEGMPGYYRNIKEKILLKYNPNADTTPTLLNLENVPLNSSKIMGALREEIQ